MNKKGFTLVELMITITIIGILAAIGIPQYSGAVAKARCAEVTVVFGQIASAQEMYRAESRQYLPCNQAQIIQRLDIKASEMQHFDYEVESLDPFTTYTIKARAAKNMGGVKIGDEVTLTDKGVKGFSDPAGQLAKYLRGWKNN